MSCLLSKRVDNGFFEHLLDLCIAFHVISGLWSIEDRVKHHCEGVHTEQGGV